MIFNTKRDRMWTRVLLALGIILFTFQLPVIADEEVQHELEEAMEGHVISKAELIGLYQKY